MQVVKSFYYAAKGTTDMDGDSQWRTKISQPAVRKSEQFLVKNVTFASPLSKCIREMCTKGNDTIRWSQYRRLPNVVRRVRNGRHLTAADHEDKYQLSQMHPHDALPQANCAVDGRSVWTTGRRPSHLCRSKLTTRCNDRRVMTKISKPWVWTKF